MYDNTFESSYEELKTFYPVWYRDVKEMDAIWQAHGQQLDGAREGLKRFLLNNFIESADEESITRWERFLHIVYDGPRTLGERRTVVAAYFLGKGHIGEPEIKEIFSRFTDGQISAKLIGGTVWVYVVRDIGEKRTLSDCFGIMEKRIPAHLGFAINDITSPIPIENWQLYRLLFQNFIVTASVQNLGPIIYLDGQHLLDGSWLLDQRLGKNLPMGFAMAGSFFHHLQLGGGWSSAVSATTNNRLVFHDWKVITTAANFGPYISLDGREKLNGEWDLSQWLKKGLPLSDLSMCAAQTNHNQLHAACLIRDTMYHLNGSETLNGTMRLNAAVIEEEL